MTFREPRILIYDIENTPVKGYTWGYYEQTLVGIDEDWWMLCFAYRWLGEEEVHVVAQPDFKRDYKRNLKDDRRVVRKLWDLFDEADIIVAHNGDRFDEVKARARFLKHGLGAPKSYKTIDTKKVASREFKLTANKLDVIAQYLGLGHKMPNTGMDLWFGCMEGDPESWDTMKRYNVHDVELLEDVYLAMRPFMTNHPNMALLAGTGALACTRCLSLSVQRRGYHYTSVSRFPKYKCNDCGSYSRSRLAEKLKDHPKPQLV